MSDGNPLTREEFDAALGAVIQVLSEASTKGDFESRDINFMGKTFLDVFAGNEKKMSGAGYPLLLQLQAQAPENIPETKEKLAEAIIQRLNESKNFLERLKEYIEIGYEDAVVQESMLATERRAAQEALRSLGRTCLIKYSPQLPTPFQENIHL